MFSAIVYAWVDCHHSLQPEGFPRVSVNIIISSCTFSPMTACEIPMDLIEKSKYPSDQNKLLFSVPLAGEEVCLLAFRSFLNSSRSSLSFCDCEAVN